MSASLLLRSAKALWQCFEYTINIYILNISSLFRQNFAYLPTPGLSNLFFTGERVLNLPGSGYIPTRGAQKNWFRRDEYHRENGPIENFHQSILCGIVSKKKLVLLCTFFSVLAKEREKKTWRIKIF